MQLLHISDTHLGKRQYGQDFREQDVYNVFNKLIDIAINERVDAIIHTGDFFDVYEPQNRAEIEAIKALKRLKEHNIPFISIAGDHDTPKKSDGRYPQDLLAELDLIKFLKNDKYVVGDVYIYGISHVPNTSKEKLKQRLYALKAESKKSILMLHQGFKELLPYEGAWQIGISDLPKSFSYYACGHIHDRTLKRLDDGRILEIAGSPDIMREEEIEGYKKNGKGATLIDFSKDEPRVQFINLDIRPQLVEKLDTTKLDEEIKRILNSLRIYKDRPILHIILTGISIPRDHLNKRLEILRQYASLVRIFKDETKVVQQAKNIELPSNARLDDLIIEYLTKIEGFSKDEAEMILEMIKHADDKEYVKKQLKKMLGIEEKEENKQTETEKKKNVSWW